jgi:nucleoid-associated protein YgaU
MTEAVNQVSSFGIRELSGEERSVVLVARALPYRPLTLETSQRVELTWYPGNPSATATVLGAQEEPTRISGYWKDKFVGQVISEEATFNGSIAATNIYPITVNGTAVQDVRAAAALIDSIVRQGQLLEVTWDEVTRHGFIKKFSKKWFTLRDLEWDMDCVWTSRGEPVTPAILVNELSTSDATSAVAAQNVALQNLATITFAVSTAKQTALLTVLGAVDDAVSSIVATNTELSRGSLRPVDAARRATAACNTLLTGTNALVRELTQRPLFFASSERDLSTSFSQRVSAYSYARSLVDAAQTLGRQAIEYRAAMLGQVDDAILAVYTARAGDDLRNVSQTFYKTPQEWSRIMLFNSLTTSQVSAGAVLLIPRISTGGARR